MLNDILSMCVALWAIKVIDASKRYAWFSSFIYTYASAGRFKHKTHPKLFLWMAAGRDLGRACEWRLLTCLMLYNPD